MAEKEAEEFEDTWRREEKRLSRTAVTIERLLRRGTPIGNSCLSLLSMIPSLVDGYAVLPGVCCDVASLIGCLKKRYSACIYSAVPYPFGYITPEVNYDGVESICSVFAIVCST